MNPTQAPDYSSHIKAMLRQSAQRELDRLAASQQDMQASQGTRAVRQMASAPNPTPSLEQVSTTGAQGLQRALERVRRYRPEYQGSDEEFAQAYARDGDQLVYDLPGGEALRRQQMTGQQAPMGVSTARPLQASTDWADFIKRATAVAAKEGFPVEVLLGQAALETGRKSKPGNNYFGIKGSGTAGTQNLATKEADLLGRFFNTKSNFAAYNSPEESIQAYINLIKTRYPDAWKHRNNPKKMIQAIKKGGYATDPDYVAKVMSTPEFQGRYGN